MDVGDEWSKVAEVYSTRFQRATNEFSKKAVEKLIPFIEAKFNEKESTSLKYLDVGSGPGIFVIELLEMLPVELRRGHVHVTDFSSGMVELAKTNLTKYANENMTFQYDVMDFHKLELDNDVYDFVICMFCIFFAKDRPKVMYEMYRVNKPNGLTVMSSWHRNEILSCMEEFARYVKALEEGQRHPTLYLVSICADPDIFKQELLDAGYKSAEVVLVDYFFIIPANDEGIYQGLIKNPAFLQMFNNIVPPYQLWVEYMNSDRISPWRQSDGSMKLNLIACVAIAQK